MDTVGADQDIAPDAAAMRAVAIEKVRGDSRLVLREGAEAVARVHPTFAQSRPHRLMDHALQPAAVNRELRHVVACVNSARLAPDLLAETIRVNQLMGAYRDRVQP